MSSNDIAVSVRGLSKSYTIAHNTENHTTLTEAMLHRFKNLVQKAEKETFWALKDVEFDIQKGDVVGIIGRNGAGKSTLLKILSQITEPTEGEIQLYGRVGSLLEVGTGFHPELTGRENVFLNGAILGMRKSEIQRQFDAIVDFAEVEKFLDTPVKRYSSGMYVRLAFAVAAHLNPEILIVDEVLAVGDANFQNKCLGKMEEVSATGRTVIFVSHNMPTILRLCKSAVLLGDGKVLSVGRAESIANDYLTLGNGSSASGERIWKDMNAAPGDLFARLCAVRILDDTGNITEKIDIRKPFFIEIDYECLGSIKELNAAFHIINESGTVLFASADFNDQNKKVEKNKPGLVRSTCHIPGNFLAEGRFSILAAVCSYNPDTVHAIENDAVAFMVIDQTEKDGVRGPAASKWPGLVRPMLEWSVISINHER